MGTVLAVPNHTVFRGAFMVDVKADRPMTTLLHNAAGRGHYLWARVLLYFGADPDALNVNRNTPLEIAIIAGHAETARVLLRGGADANAPYKESDNTQLDCPDLSYTMSEILRAAGGKRTKPLDPKVFGSSCW